jgi:hypothetical protein
MGFARIACPKAPDYLAMILRQEWQTIREHRQAIPSAFVKNLLKYPLLTSW